MNFFVALSGLTRHQESCPSSGAAYEGVAFQVEHFHHESASTFTEKVVPFLDKI